VGLMENKYQKAIDYIVKNSCNKRVACNECDIQSICNSSAKSRVDNLQELVDKTTWIPVEKKLPPMFVKVLITYEDNDFIPRRSLAYINESHEWIYPLMNNYKYRVIAWMPLPKPYLGSDENDR
jgi:hypothetical protein